MRNKRYAARGCDTPAFYRICLVALLGVFLLAGCEVAAPPLPQRPASSSRVRLQAGDVIKLNFPGSPDFNQVQKIREDGMITLQVVGEVRAAGKTLGQFQSELTARYKPELKNNDVIVTLDSAVTSVYLTGAVAKPGKMAFDRPTTILQAIMEGGGPTEFGSLKNVRIIRLENGVQRTFSVNLRDTMAGATTPPAYVKDGDVISVPATSF